MTDFSLDDLMVDPLTRQLMASDAVEETEIRALAERVRERPARRVQEPRSFSAPD